ncbi:MAG: arginine repressor [Paludibacteraceae bacterium]|nr:arginine repressor [Paludibacteraceae bacterium]MDD5997997.1 arginine repressor [Bacteroidales bacterium]MBP5525914.1 arginine repressor [Paludibacteraceae bacterium]MBQ6560849.1 arginine repressor [Paludibacteraceae bacterium]MBR6112150.1 arginine repressor [Paludibacteraceae bacterium]
MKNKNRRISVIQEIIATTKVGSQDELLQLLTNKGFNLTQATLSRDLKAMKVVKTPAVDGGYCYKLPANDDQADAQAAYLTSAAVTIDFSGNILVIHTRAGYASSMAYRIDDEASDVIIGTVAGEDTVVCVMKEGMTKRAVIESLSKFIPTLKKD